MKSLCLDDVHWKVSHTQSFLKQSSLICVSVDQQMIPSLYRTIFNVLLSVQELLKVFKELGFKGEEKISFSTLSQHPFMQDLIEGSSQYLLPVSITHKHYLTHILPQSSVVRANTFIILGIK